MERQKSSLHFPLKKESRLRFKLRGPEFDKLTLTTFWRSPQRLINYVFLWNNDLLVERFKLLKLYQWGHLVNECVGLAKKRGVRWTCGWKLFFALIFCYFFIKKKVEELEAFYNADLFWSIQIIGDLYFWARSLTDCHWQNFGGCYNGRAINDFYQIYFYSMISVFTIVNYKIQCALNKYWKICCM